MGMFSDLMNKIFHHGAPESPANAPAPAPHRAHAGAVDTGVAREPGCHDLAAARQLVREGEGGPRKVGEAAGDAELVVEPEWPQVADAGLGHDHVDASVVHLGVAVAGGSQELDAADLEVLQVGRVVGDAHRVGLAEADSQVDDGATGPGGNHPRQGNGKPSEAAGTLS